MKLLHTADWHLGKTLKGQSLIDDQEYILKQILDIAKDVDAVLIAGDIYDRGIPPADAVNLFDETLNRLAEKKLPTLIIAGNHDSATRLNFGSKIFANQNIFIVSKVTDQPAQIVLEDDFGEVYFSLIPYFAPIEIQTKFFGEDSERLTFNDANKFYIDLARKKIPDNKRSVAIAHVFLTGGIESDSERKFVGGAANVDSKVFNEYSYVALGHLHSPQKISVENIRYSGSPLKYSFDEANHKKSVTIIDLDDSGAVEIEKIPLIPRRDLIVVEGKFNELANREPTQDYAQIILTDDAYIYDTENLRDAFPNFLEIKRKSHLVSYDDATTDRTFCKEDSISEQFDKFFTEITSEPLTEEERMAFEEVLREIEREGRE
ncbi:MAG: exonuclease SbcCD subunit D [Selenomonadaceae bacterium]|nr:exonuclease SbcCD subunit D [Selenomonadaceae bacterium]